MLKSVVAAILHLAVPWGGSRAMSIRVGSVGPRGLALLAAVGVAALALGVQGWSARHVGLMTSATGGFSAPVRSSPAASTPQQAASSGATSTGKAASGPASSPAPSGAGPLLSSEPYASFAYQVWPGPAGAAAQQAMTGLAISVRRQGSGISVTAGVSGQPAPAAHTYPNGARVYVLEASLGDDSGGSDFNLGDDGLVVTDAQGRIAQ
jgi:hypothetical protein